MKFDPKITMKFLVKQMVPDIKWIEIQKNGFKWAYSKFGQEVFYEEARHTVDPEMIGYFYTIKAPMLKGLKNTPENRKIINDYLCFNASVCIPLYDANTETLSIVSRVDIHEGIVGWMSKILSIVMVMQQHEVLTMAEQIAQLTNSQLDYYNHPDSGIREGVDEIVKVYDDLIIPFGLTQSIVKTEEIKDVAENYMQDFPCVLTNYSDSSITTEFPFGKATSLLQFETCEPHPDYGYGISLTHSFYQEKNEEKGILTAMQLNAMLAKSNMTYGLGSYLYRNGFIVYRMFVPNFVYQYGLLKNLYFTSIGRAMETNKFFNLPPWTKDSVQDCQKNKLDALEVLARLMK